MAEAFAWGLLASSSLLIGGLLALSIRIGSRTLGLIMAFGSGVLISAVAYELVLEAFNTSKGADDVAFGLFAGCAVYSIGDALIDRMGGAQRKHSGGAQQGGSGLAIVLGIVLDGIPESIVLGLTLVGGGGVGFAILAAIFLSNLPEAVAATSGLSTAGWTRSRVVGLWLLVMLVSGLAALAGFGLFEDASPSTIAFIDAFAGGAILTMLADTMMPEAFQHGGKLVGVLTTVGFALAFALTSLE